MSLKLAHNLSWFRPTDFFSLGFLKVNLCETAARNSIQLKPRVITISTRSVNHSFLNKFGIHLRNQFHAATRDFRGHIEHKYYETETSWVPVQYITETFLILLVVWASLRLQTWPFSYFSCTAVMCVMIDTRLPRTSPNQWNIQNITRIRAGWLWQHVCCGI